MLYIVEVYFDGYEANFDVCVEDATVEIGRHHLGKMPYRDMTERRQLYDLSLSLDALVKIFGRYRESVTAGPVVLAMIVDMFQFVHEGRPVPGNRPALDDYTRTSAALPDPQD